MPALPAGQTQQFVGNDSGGITVTVNWNPATDAMDVNPAVSATSTFPGSTPIHITGPNQVVHTVNVPTGTTNISPAQLAAFGITTHSQIADLPLSL